MAMFNKGERTVLRVLLIVAGILLAITSGGFMLLANALDGLGGMGNPSAEMQQRAQEASSFRNLVLICLIVGGGGLALLGLMIFPRAKNTIQPRRNPMKDVK